MSLFSAIKRRLKQHDSEVNQAWGRALYRHRATGISLLYTTNGHPIVVASRHPPRSITWTWSLWWGGGLQFRLSTQKPMWKETAT